MIITSGRYDTRAAHVEPVKKSITSGGKSVQLPAKPAKRANGAKQNPISKGLIPRAIFLGEMRKFSREIIVRMRDKGNKISREKISLRQ